MLSLCSSPVFVLIFIVCLGTNFVVSAFCIFLKFFSLFFKIIWSHREVPLSSFILSAFFFWPPSSFLLYASLFFNCHFCSSTATYTLSLHHLWMDITAWIMFITIAGGVFAVGPLKTAGKLALRGHGWQAAIASLHTALGQSALAHPALGWALSEHCSIPMEQQHHYEGGKYDWWTSVYRMNNTANQHKRGERVLEPGCWCQAGDYSGCSSTIATGAMQCEDGEGAD